METNDKPHSDRLVRHIQKQKPVNLDFKNLFCVYLNSDDAEMIYIILIHLLRYKNAS